MQQTEVGIKTRPYPMFSFNCNMPLLSIISQNPEKDLSIAHGFGLKNKFKWQCIAHVVDISYLLNFYGN